MASQLRRFARIARAHRVELALLAAVVAVSLTAHCQRPTPEPEPALATFNIRDFPERPEQVPAAFETMRELGVKVIAVQEIMNPETFQAAARKELGRDWQAVFNHELAHDQADPPRRVGLAWSGAHYQLDFFVTHEDVRVRPGQRPALEVRLVPRHGGPALRVFVVHLKAGGNEDDERLRREQLAQLRLVVGDAMRSPDEVVVLGDFNTTGPADRVALAEFAEDTMLIWASLRLPCTAYWRPGGTCQGSALDHVFTREYPVEIAAKGACEQVGCEPGEQCPIDYDRVSDHCPVVVELDLER